VKLSQEQANKLILIVGCLAFFAPPVLWPLSAFTFWSNQPQGVMALSWMAIILTGAVLLLQAVTKRDIDS
jgi:hypothetical protein